MTRHLIEIAGLSASDVRHILELSVCGLDQLGTPLSANGTALGAALIFEKPSLRTRHSMEMAVVQLGGHPVATRGEEIGFDRREPVEDITRILAGYHAVLAARVFDHGMLERMAAVSSVPVVNMLSGRSHPLQALADALTMRQSLGELAGKVVAWVGDYNNVARSLGEISALLGAHVRYACPDGFAPDAPELERLGLLGAQSVRSDRRPIDAVDGADAVHSDTWVSMGDEADARELRRAFEGFTVTNELMQAAAPGAVFLHCLPAHRGLEVHADVIDGPASVVLRQGHNRVHTARGALAFLLGAGTSS
ncbi:ornithine carbamoyltransferase [soil metagenome]